MQQNIIRLFFVILLAAINCHVNVWAQEKNITIKGQITDKSSHLPMAGVVVTTGEENHALLKAYSDTTGYYTVVAGSAGALHLHFDLSGYKILSLTVSPEKNPYVLNVEMEPLSRELAEVEIKSTKKAITFDGDKLIVNPEKIPGTSGSNALDVLKKVPGVTVENDEVLKVNGKTDITLLINDRKRSFTPEQAIRLLRSIPAANIRNIEITTGKSARFDAEGAGGVINIQTKKALADGYNLELSNTLNINSYIGHQHNLFCNMKAGAFSLYASLGYEQNYNYSDRTSHAVYSNTAPNSQTKTRDTNNYYAGIKTPYMDIGVDYQLDKRQVLSIATSLYYSVTKSNNDLNTILDKENPAEIVNLNAQKTSEDLHSFDVVYENKLDSAGSKLKVDLGYLAGYSIDKPLFQNTYLDDKGKILEGPVNIRARIPLEGFQYIGQLDYEKVLGKSQSLQAGFKYTRSNIYNYVGYDTVKNDQLFRDQRQSDSLLYRERVTALYISYKHPIGNLNVMLGLRYEYTDMENISLKVNDVYKRTYSDIFPYINVAYNGDNIRSAINLSKSITRPYYGYLNPYIKYIDEFNYQQGNSLLKPTYTYNINLNNHFYDLIYLTLGYYYTKDAILLLKRRKDDDLVTVYTPENAMNYSMFYGSVGASFSFFKDAWQGQMGISGFFYKPKVKPEFVTSTSEPGILGQFSANILQSVRLKKNLFFETEYYYYHKNKSNQVTIAGRWQLNAGLKINLLQGKLTTAVYLQDIFYTMKQDIHKYYDNYVSDARLDPYTQKLKLSVVLNLGELKSNYNKQTSTGKEASRFKSN
ncbi:outer membrane beta-barrel protein [Chitinophaga sp.]|uniref:outer membrane beta-barrel protein n=1 Tax=Chitinophaga sp. TaxID=1869181 RepID=UPI0031CFA9B5